MDLFYLGLKLFFGGIIGAIINFGLTFIHEDVRITMIGHLLCGLVYFSGIACMVVWLAQMLYAAAT